MMHRVLITIVAAVFASSAAAQNVDSKVTAANGVVVDIVSDEFAGRAEYSAPKVDIDGGGFLLVAAIKRSDQLTPVFVTGSIYYRGEWRRYNEALFRGGEAVDASFADRDVVSCSGSRYGGCSLREGFRLNPTAEQISKYSEDGNVIVQLRAGGLYPVMVRIPRAYFDAVAEASHQPGWSPPAARDDPAGDVPGGGD